MVDQTYNAAQRGVFMHTSRGFERDQSLIGAVLKTGALGPASNTAQDDFYIYIGRGVIRYRGLVYNILVGSANALAHKRTELIAPGREHAAFVQNNIFYGSGILCKQRHGGFQVLNCISLTLKSSCETACGSNCYALHVNIIDNGGDIASLNTDGGEPCCQLLTCGD